ncbi:MAG TPA: N-acetylmuramoyl-L-alanine amidase, partial [Chloroflexia bacterium]|nr:N-acetylmuramoyl-L-alanine amidase [Chloroflexia bacterium]
PTDRKTYTVQYFERARFEEHPELAADFLVSLGLLGRTIAVNRTTDESFAGHATRPSGAGAWFPETGHLLAPEILPYWQAHGGLPVYGYPISDAFTEASPTDGKPYLVQYFERNRLEYHPELPEAYRVSLGLLGVQVLQDRGWLP